MESHMTLTTEGYTVVSSNVGILDARKSLERNVFQFVLGNGNERDTALLMDFAYRTEHGYTRDCIYRNGNKKSPKLPKGTGRILTYLDLAQIHARADAAQIVSKVLRRNKIRNCKYYRKMDYAMYKPPGSSVSHILYDLEPTALLILSCDSNRRKNKGSFQFLRNYRRYKEILDSLFDIEVSDFEDKMKITSIPVSEMNAAITTYTQIYYNKEIDNEEWAEKIWSTWDDLPMKVPEDPYVIDWYTPSTRPGDIIIWDCPYKIEKNDTDTVFSGLYISLGMERINFTEPLRIGCVNLRSCRSLANIEEYIHLTMNHTRRFSSLIPLLTEKELELYSVDLTEENSTTEGSDID